MTARVLGLLSLLLAVSACGSSRQPAPTLDEVVWDFCFDEAEAICIRIDEQSSATLDIPTSFSSTSYSLSGGLGVRFSGPFTRIDAGGHAISLGSGTVWQSYADLGYEASSLVQSDEEDESDPRKNPRYETRSELVEGQYFGLKVESDAAVRYGWMRLTVRPRLAGFQVHDHYLGGEGEAVVVGLK